jgi:C_GCAxxG_C_C family probable redox protein
MNQSPQQVAVCSGEIFGSGLCCAESVLQAVAESRGIKSDLIPGIATGLCGGIGRSGDICGALSGGVLAINMVLGRARPDQSPERNFEAVRGFLKDFGAEFGTTNCEQLIGCRLDTPEGQRFFKENKLRERCAVYTRAAARLAAKALCEQKGATP